MPDSKKDWWTTPHGLRYREWLEQYGRNEMRAKLGVLNELDEHALARMAWYTDDAFRSQEPS